MAISRYLEEAAKLKPQEPITEDEKKAKLAELRQFIKKTETEGGIILSMHGFDFSIYHTLLPAMIYGAKKEMRHFDWGEEDKVFFAIFCAFKLSVAFGDASIAIEYLKQFEKNYPKDGRQPLHDACLFLLPKGNAWNVQLWKKIIDNMKPNHPENFILRIFQLADKIEAYVKENHDKLIQIFVEEITSEYEILFSDEYDRRPKLSEKDTWVNDKLGVKEKIIEREVQAKFDKMLRELLNLPDTGRLSPEEAEKLKASREKEKDKLAVLQKAVVAKWKEKFEKRYDDAEKKEQHSPNQDKQRYIERRLVKMEDVIKKEAQGRLARLLSSETSEKELKALERYVIPQLAYKRSSENLAASTVFHAHAMPEEAFVYYLALKPVDNPIMIPELTIDGAEINAEYSGYVLRKLSPYQPEAALLGKLTSCCQSLKEQGHEPTVYGITSPLAGFYVLYKKGGVAGQADTIVAQSLAWRHETVLVLDSIESQVDFRRHHENMLADFFALLAYKLTYLPGITRVNVGCGNTPISLREVLPIVSTVPIDYSGYRDSNFQFVIADRDLPITFIYASNNSQSALYKKKKDYLSDELLSEKSIETICDMTYASWRTVDVVEEKFHMGGEYLEFYMARWSQIHSLMERLGNSSPCKIEELEDFFLKQRLDPNTPLAHQKAKVIHFFAIKNDWEAVKWLVEHGADINFQMENGETVAHMAATGRNVDVVKWLVEHGAKPSIRSNTGADLFVVFLYQGIPDWNMGKWLAEYVDNINAIHIAGAPLHLYAAKKGQFEFLKWLIQEKSADVSLKDLDGVRLLNYAARSGQLDMTKWLFNKLNQSDAGRTSLMFMDPQTFLFDAASSGNLDLVKWIVEDLHIDAHKKNNEDQTLIHALANSRPKDSSQELALLNWLIDKGIDPHDKDSQGKTALMLAADISHWPIVLQLLKAGGDVNTVLTGGNRLIHEAAERDNCETLSYLLDHGVSINEQESSLQDTPLHCAIKLRKWRAAKLLLERGADVTLKNENGDTPLDSHDDAMDDSSDECKKVRAMILERLQKIPSVTSDMGMFTKPKEATETGEKLTQKQEPGSHNR